MLRTRHEEEVKLPLEIKFLQEHAVEIEKDQLVSLELYRLETGTSRLISSRKNITSPSRRKMVLLPRVCPLKLRRHSVRRLRVNFRLVCRLFVSRRTCG